MSDMDIKTRARITLHLQRVLILDPNPNSARILAELLRDMGARHIAVVNRTTMVLDPIGAQDPQILFTELTGPGFDGVAAIKTLRRSALPQREIPIIVYTADATVESIRAARDAGAHEFMRKPYSTKDLIRRIENVALHPRDWIEAKMYVGPDRRRFNSESYAGPRKRKSEQSASAAR